MGSHGLTVRLAEGSEPGTQRITFRAGATWIATFHTCGDTVGIAVVRRGMEAEEPTLRPRVAAILHAQQAFERLLDLLANGEVVSGR